MKEMLLSLCAVCFTLGIAAQTKEVKFSLLETTDVHGNYLPYNFITGEDGTGSMARVKATAPNGRERPRSTAR